MIWNNEWNTEWIVKFAIFPVNLDGGKTLWLQKYKQRYVKVFKPCGCVGCHLNGYWERQSLAQFKDGK